MKARLLLHQPNKFSLITTQTTRWINSNEAGLTFRSHQWIHWNASIIPASLPSLARGDKAVREGGGAPAGEWGDFSSNFFVSTTVPLGTHAAKPTRLSVMARRTSVRSRVYSPPTGTKLYADTQTHATMSKMKTRTAVNTLRPMRCWTKRCTSSGQIEPT